MIVRTELVLVISQNSRVDEDIGITVRFSGIYQIVSYLARFRGIRELCFKFEYYHYLDLFL